MRAKSGDAQFAARLRIILRERDRTPAWLDRRCGFSCANASHWLAMRHAPSLAKLRRVKRALGCSWDELLGE